MRTINITNQNYVLLDTRDKITVADSFVLNPNKIGGGNGEAKLYVGNDNSELRNFFGPKGFNINCFILKSDLLRYLSDCESEYKNPVQEYRGKTDLPYLWDERVTKVSCFPNILYFNLEEQTQISGPRIYVKSDSLYFSLIRELSLPNITYLSVLKLQNNLGQTNYYLRLFTDFFGEQQHASELIREHTKLNEEVLDEEEKNQILKANSGQGKFRKSILDKDALCPITLINDERLLIATHIKPWAKSGTKEKTDPKNGIAFTPTFSHLFQNGFISFTDDKKILVSPWVADSTCAQLGIEHYKEFPSFPIEGRKQYLEYHRRNIFKG
ncbi:HNH endonuclease [Rufibacter aurantiacus]|uniref:HNH endonuclease n=1 Tax=Rufibacter aurantiacus TaxID=2817374 RepID=UPI001B304B76|nr:HNH endonuclease signature motif containing protein [Rufibacter aurantiacus]